MYALKALLIGCADNVLPDLRHELKNLLVGIEGEFVDALSCLAHILAHPAKDRLFIIQPKDDSEIAQLERLNESAVGQPVMALVEPSNGPSLMMAREPPKSSACPCNWTI